MALYGVSYSGQRRKIFGNSSSNPKFSPTSPSPTSLLAHQAREGGSAGGSSSVSSGLGQERKAAHVALEVQHPMTPTNPFRDIYDDMNSNGGVLASPYKVYPASCESPEWHKPWHWPKVSPVIDIFIPIKKRTKQRSKNLTNGSPLGWLPMLIVPFSPAFHAAWWHQEEGGRRFVQQLGDSAYLDEDEITSPLLEDDGYALWPWEKWFRKKKKKKVMSSNDLYVLSSNKYRFDELDVSTPTWQRYYDKASNKIEGYAEQIKDRRRATANSSKSVGTQTDDFVGWIPCEGGGGDEPEKILASASERSRQSSLFSFMEPGKEGAKGKKKTKRRKGRGKAGSKEGKQGQPDEDAAPAGRAHRATSTASLDSELGLHSNKETIIPSGAMSPRDLKLPDVTDWPTRPVYARFNQTHEPIPINIRGDEGFVEFETELFKGKLSLSIADLENSQMQSIFDGRKRRYRYAVTGKFKRRLSYANCYTGQEIKSVKTDKGTAWLMSSMRWMMRSLSPAMRELEDKNGNKMVLAPVAATAQRMAVRTKDEPSALNESGDTVEEDLTKLGGGTFKTPKGTALGPENRKKIMSKPEELNKYTFDTENTYTMEFYQHLFDPLSFHMNVVGLSTFDVCSVIGRQPVRIMARLWDTEEYLWSFELWHERVFTEDDNAAGGASA